MMSILRHIFGYIGVSWCQTTVVWWPKLQQLIGMMMFISMSVLFAATNRWAFYEPHASLTPNHSVKENITEPMFCFIDTACAPHAKVHSNSYEH